MIRIKEVIAVEGRCDKSAVLKAVEATVIETKGFGVFSDGDKLKLLRRMAEAKGLIVLTDSDGAGFVIRSYLKGAIDGKNAAGGGNIKHAYIPDIPGKEKRKRAPSKAGTLGVEGMAPEVILDALRRAGATVEGEAESAERGETGRVIREKPITKADLYAWGLSGRPDSAARRRELLQRLDLPELLSA
ncbi:MAG: DUF4093 domain-containing protein, partial [Firmicutes bacterium]|nr:DUF4093 domain-containing protein [Bacillota bacterium]